MKFLRAIFPPVHKHPQKFPHEWSTLTAELDPFRPFEFREEGVWKRIQLDAETVTNNGLVLDVADGLFKVEVN